VHLASTRSTVVDNPQSRTLTRFVDPTNTPTTCNDEIFYPKVWGRVLGKKVPEESTVSFKDSGNFLYNSMEYVKGSSHAENQQ